MGKIKKIIAGAVIVAVVGCAAGAGLMQIRKNSQKTVNVTDVSNLLQTYYSSNTTIDGKVTTSATQTVSGDKDLIIDQVYVSKDDTVKVGDPLVSFDTTLVEMELNIARLKKQKQEQDLNKAVNRLKSLQNGGPVEESDGGTSADNLDTMDNADSDSNTTSGNDNDLLSFAGNLNGNYLAAAMHPYLLTAFTDDAVSAGEGNSGSDGALDSAQTSTAEGEEEPGDADSAEGIIRDTPNYADPSASDFADGTKDDFSGGTSDGNIEAPELTPTPTPVLDDNTTYFNPYYTKGDPNITDGNEPFYEKLDANSIPFTGSGTQEDPYVYLCSSTKEKVTVMGSFFNKLAGYSPDGTKIDHEGGYWYQLEFHKNDTIANYEDRKESCIGYYLINGSLLENTVYEFAEVEFTLADASTYDTVPDDDIPDGGDDPGTNDKPVTISRADAIKYQQSRIATLKLDIQESDIKIAQLEKKAAKKLISSKLDGTVTYVGDTTGGTTDGNALIRVKNADGFYVVGTISELMLDDVQEGTILNCNSYNSGQFEAEVMEVSEYPVDSSNVFSYGGDSNPNVSYYAFTAVVTDKTLVLQDSDWVTIEIQQSADDGQKLVIDKAFVKSENGKNYVYKDDNGILKKQEISVGSTVNSGYSIIVKGGLSADDKIAFPYGKDVQEGAKTVEVSYEQMYGYE